MVWYNLEPDGKNQHFGCRCVDDLMLLMILIWSLQQIRSFLKTPCDAILHTKNQHYRSFFVIFSIYCHYIYQAKVSFWHKMINVTISTKRETNCKFRIWCFNSRRHKYCNVLIGSRTKLPFCKIIIRVHVENDVFHFETTHYQMKIWLQLFFGKYIFCANFFFF